MTRESRPYNGCSATTYSNSWPLTVFTVSGFSQPNSSDTVFNSSDATTNFRSPTATTEYSNSGWTEIPKFAGIVQGVVVQITISVSPSNTPLPSLTRKAT